MKKKKIIAIVLIAAALLSAFGGFSISSSAPEMAETISNAVFVSDGKVLAENEGKVVIVPGTLYAEPFVDEETGITVSSPVTFRNVERLYIEEKSEKDSDKKTKVWQWKVDMIGFGGDKKLVAPNVTLGEFAVDGDLIQSLTTNKKRQDYLDEELNQMGFTEFYKNGITYLYQGERMPNNDDGIDSVNLGFEKNAYLDYVGTYRVNYTEMDAGPDFTIIALQQNGRLVRVPC